MGLISAFFHTHARHMTRRHYTLVQLLEDHHVGPLILCQTQCVQAVGREQHSEALLGQIAPQQFPQALLVILH